MWLNRWPIGLAAGCRSLAGVWILTSPYTILRMPHGKPWCHEEKRRSFSAAADGCSACLHAHFVCLLPLALVCPVMLPHCRRLLY